MGADDAWLWYDRRGLSPGEGKVSRSELRVPDRQDLLSAWPPLRLWLAFIARG